MNRNPQSLFDQSSAQIRIVCAAAAVVATLATLGFVDALAHGYGPVLAKSVSVVIAQR